MTFDVYEKSSWDGQPAELYEFRLGTTVWRHTNVDTNLVHGGFTWSAQQISRSESEQGAEINREPITITVPRDHVVANLFLAQPPGGIVLVTVYRYHRTDPDEEDSIQYQGRIVSVAWSASQATMQCDSNWTSVRAPGLIRKFGAECPWTLYQDGCLVNALSYQLLDTVSSVSGMVVQVAGASAHADNYYAGGTVVWHDSMGATHTRWIVEHTGEYLTLAAPIHGMGGGDPVEVYPGCDFTTATCESKFDNLDNYGGWPYTPTESPFEVSIL